MKKFSVILVGLTIILLISGCGNSTPQEATETQAMKSGLTREIPKKTAPAYTPETAPVTTTPPAPSSNTKFEQIGAYNPQGTFEAGLEADSYYVLNPTKSAIRQFCEEQQKERLGELKDLNRSLVISFYDDKAHTPNYAQGYDPSDQSEDAYRIADYVINPVGNLDQVDQVEFSKEIPE